MKTTINQILFIKDILKSVITEKSISPKFKMQLMLAIDPIENILEKAETLRVDLIKEMGTEEEDGSIKVAQDKMLEFSNKLNDLYNSEVEIPTLTCTLDDLQKAESLSVLDMKTLIDFTKNKELKEEASEVSEVIE